MFFVEITLAEEHSLWREIERGRVGQEFDIERIDEYFELTGRVEGIVRAGAE